MSISLARELTVAVGTPRAVFVKWPLGHPLGAPRQPMQQRTLIFDALGLLLTAKTPGTIAEPGYHWKRATYTEPDWSRLKGTAV